MPQLCLCFPHLTETGPRRTHPRRPGPDQSHPGLRPDHTLPSTPGGTATSFITHRARMPTQEAGHQQPHSWPRAPAGIPRASQAPCPLAHLPHTLCFQGGQAAARPTSPHVNSS